MRYLSLICLSFLVACSLGCGADRGAGGDTTATQVKQTVEKAAQTTADFAWEQKESFTKQMKEKFDALDKQMDALKAQGKNLSSDARTRWEKTMAQLEAQKQALKKHLDQAADTSADQWGKFSKDAADAYQQLETGMKNAAEQFQKPAHSKTEQ